MKTRSSFPEDLDESNSASRTHFNLNSGEKWLLGLAFLFALLGTFDLMFRIRSSKKTDWQGIPFTKAQFIKHDPHRYEVRVISKMWNFQPQNIKIPTGSLLDFYITSVDIHHGFHILGTNLNLIATPGLINHESYFFDRPGTYPILCQEYCGLGHAMMNIKLEVLNDLQEGEAVDTSKQSLEPGDDLTPLPGKQVFESKGCIACHSVNGSPGIGPTIEGLWGREEEFDDGSKIKVDEPYLRESLENPSKRVVKGFSPVMPEIQLTPEEIDQLIEYAKSLK